MIKRIISTILVLVLVLLTISPNVYADSATSDLVVIQDPVKLEEIERLLELRRELETNSITNESLLQKIDLQLAILGVEQMTTQEVAEKLGYNTADPSYDVNSTSTVKWTTWRTMASYRGTLYELQIIEGTPANVNSPLIQSNLTIDFSSKGLKAGAINAIKVVSVDALGYLPRIGTPLSIGITAYDALSAFCEGMTGNTTLDDVSGTTTVTLTTHLRYIFVKVKDTPDDGNQILCYSGNRVYYEVEVDPIILYMDGNIARTYDNLDYEIEDQSESEYYATGSNCYNVSVQKYYNYKYYGTDFIRNYQIQRITFNTFGTPKTYTIPYLFP